MRSITLACAFLLSFVLATSAHAQTTFVNPNGNGGYTITRPGGPTTFVNPTGNGGFIANTPGYGTSFGSPSGNGEAVSTRTPPSER